MRTRIAPVSIFLLASLSALGQSPSARPTSAGIGKVRNHFDADTPLRPPAFFDFVVLGAPGESEWKVVLGRAPFSSPNQVTQVVDGRPGDSIAVAVRRGVAFRDGGWSVAIQNGTGRGGIAFRIADEKNFRVLLVDLSTGEAVLAAHERGNAVELARAKASVDNPWGILSIAANGTRITASWNGKPLLEAIDPGPASGRAGIATAGPGLVSFDEFILDPTPDR